MTAATGSRISKLTRYLIVGTGATGAGLVYLGMTEPFHFKAPQQIPPKVYKVKDLPIYEPAIESRVVHTTSSPSQIGKYKEAIQGYVTATRQSSQAVTDRADQIWETSKAHTAGLVYTLQESGPVTRGAVVTSAALFGILLGIRGGKVKKAVYGTLAATGMAALLHPTEAKELFSPVTDTCNTMAEELRKNVTSFTSVSFGNKKTDEDEKK